MEAMRVSSYKKRVSIINLKLPPFFFRVHPFIFPDSGAVSNSRRSKPKKRHPLKEESTGRASFAGGGGGGGALISLLFFFIIIFFLSCRHIISARPAGESAPRRRNRRRPQRSAGLVEHWRRHLSKRVSRRSVSAARLVNAPSTCVMACKPTAQNEMPATKKKRRKGVEKTRKKTLEKKSTAPPSCN